MNRALRPCGLSYDGTKMRRCRTPRVHHACWSGQRPLTSCWREHGESSFKLGSTSEHKTLASWPHSIDQNNGTSLQSSKSL